MVVLGVPVNGSVLYGKVLGSVWQCGALQGLSVRGGARFKASLGSAVQGGAPQGSRLGAERLGDARSGLAGFVVRQCVNGEARTGKAVHGSR